MNMIKREVNKIVDAYNNRMLKFIFKYGILKAMFTVLIICLIFAFLGNKDFDAFNMLLNFIIRMAVAIIPGIAWGITDYYMYKDIIEEREKFRLNTFLYILLYGILGWGLVCSACNVTFVPFDKLSLIAAVISIPIYGIVLGIVSKKLYNKKLIKQIYEEYIKGKDIKAVKSKKK